MLTWPTEVLPMHQLVARQGTSRCRACPVGRAPRGTWSRSHRWPGAETGCGALMWWQLVLQKPHSLMVEEWFVGSPQESNRSTWIIPVLGTYQYETTTILKVSTLGTRHEDQKLTESQQAKDHSLLDSHCNACGIPALRWISGNAYA